MHNYLNQLVTELKLCVIENGHNYQAALDQPLQFSVNSTVSIDGLEILPRFCYLAKNNQLIIDQPFYCWYHLVTHQGWLLLPS